MEHGRLESTGISQSTFYHWLQVRETAKSGRFMEFSESLKKAGVELDVSNLAVIQRAATASDRSDLKPPWLTASGQTTILLHSGGGSGVPNVKRHCMRQLVHEVR